MGIVGAAVCHVAVLAAVPAGVRCMSVVLVFAVCGAEGTHTLP